MYIYSYKLHKKKKKHYAENRYMHEVCVSNSMRSGCIAKSECPLKARLHFVCGPPNKAGFEVVGIF